MMTAGPREPPAAGAGPRHGFSLVEMAIVLTILGVLLGVGLETLATYADRENRKLTVARLEEAYEALVLFVTRNARLPCPADGQLADTAAGAGDEDDGGDGDPADCATGSDRYSVVPWRTLGLPRAAALDGWRRRITYVPFDTTTSPDGVPNGTTRAAAVPNPDGGMDMSECLTTANLVVAAIGECDPPDVSNPDGDSPTEFLINRGLRIFDGTGFADPADVILGPALPDRGGGAAFVLISHGPDGGGAYLRNGTRMPLPGGTQLNQLENTDHASDDDYVDAQRDEADPTAASYFDDYVLAPSIHEVVSRAGLDAGP